MRFGSWYPLTDAAGHAPASEGIVQLRLRTGLIDYPRGKSAMVWYQHAPDVRAAAAELARWPSAPDLVCRHLIEIDPTTVLPAFYAKLTTEFVRRFGAPPTPEVPRCT